MVGGVYRLTMIETPCLRCEDWHLYIASEASDIERSYRSSLPIRTEDRKIITRRSRRRWRTFFDSLAIFFAKRVHILRLEGGVWRYSRLDLMNGGVSVCNGI